MRSVFLTVFLVVMLTGCAAQEPETHINTEIKPQKMQKEKQQAPVAPVVNELEQAADSIQLDLEKLAKLRQMGYEKIELYKTPESGPLSKKITLKWNGPLKPVLKIIADKISFTFRVKGEAPPRSILVNIDETETPVFSVLEDLGWKAGKHQVSVDSNREIVQLTYFEKRKKKSDD